VSKTSPDLSGVFLKLERAEEHIETVREQVESFRKRNPPPFGFRTEETPGQNKSIKYALYATIREEPPRELSLPVGDAIQNMRSALDHLIYELATPSGRRSRRLQFPIFTDECEFKVLSPPLIQSITGDERTLIERVQPYAATNPPSDDPLTVLRKLSNRDKHRLLVPMIAAVSEPDSWVGSDNAEIRFTYLARGPVEHDTKIVAFTATPKDPTEDMKVHPQSGLEIQIGDTGIVGFALGAVDLLEMLQHHVRHSIIAMWFTFGHMPLTWAEVQALQ
jgi:hypothetical protein